MKAPLTALLLALGSVISASAAAPAHPPFLAVGAIAPDFTAQGPNSTPVKLSDFHGKVVLVDFWATWCGPCKVTMPHMEKLHAQLAAQGLVVLGVCVWDTREKFDAWEKAPEVSTTYRKVFDPAGRGPEGIASSLYGVTGIPSFFLVNGDGKVVYSGVGAGPQTERGLEAALRTAGFKL